VSADYAIFVFPRPWAWLSLAFAVLSLAGYAMVVWRQRQIRRRIAHIAEPLVDICRRHGFVDEAEQIQADIDRLRRELDWRRIGRKSRTEAAA
jgi:DNA anti-recombination protein RmuC